MSRSLHKLDSFLKNLQQKNSFLVLSLAALFFVAFATPLFFAAKFGGLFRNENTEEPAEEITRDTLFPQAFKIGAPNSYIDVKNSESLNPLPEQDYVLVFWIRPKKLPAADEKMMVLSKIDSELRSRRGFAFSLTRELDVIRPEVYWRDDQNGTWFKFSEATLVPNAWTMFVLTFRQDKFLGLHYATVVENLEPELKVLGGYELENKVFPNSRADLQVGAIGSSRFKGQVGPLGIFSKPEITADLNSILNDLIKEPLSVPEEFLSEDVKLWVADTEQDQSANKNTVTFVKPKKGK